MTNTIETPDYISPQKWINRKTIGNYDAMLDQQAAMIFILEVLLIDAKVPSLKELTVEELIKDFINCSTERYKQIWADKNDCSDAWNAHVENGGQS